MYPHSHANYMQNRAYVVPCFVLTDQIPCDSFQAAALEYLISTYIAVGESVKRHQLSFVSKSNVWVIMTSYQTAALVILGWKKSNEKRHDS